MLEIWRLDNLNKNTAENSRRYVLLALGVSVCLIGALLMVVEGSVLGENHSAIATVIGIVGIGIIANSNTISKKTKIERRDA